MQDDSSFTRRATELEIQLAHQQRLCEQLNDVVIDHTNQILKLERVVLRLEDQIKTLREQRKEAFDPRLEKPPHY